MEGGFSIVSGDVSTKRKKPEVQSYECFISKGVMILCLDTLEMDVINLPLGQMIGFEIRNSKELLIRIGGNSVYYETETRPSVIISDIREKLKTYYKTTRGF